MNEPVRILNLFTIMNRGGAETMVMNYYRKADKRRIQFDFMVHRQERGAYDDEIEAMGGRIFRMCPIYPQNLFRYKRLLREFFSAHPEYRVLHSHMSELGYFAFREAVRHQVPVRICHAHSVPVLKTETFIEKLKYYPRLVLARAIRNYTTGFFACSQEAGEWLFGTSYKDRVHVLKNAIDTGLYRYDSHTDMEIRNRYGWEGKFIVGHVGRFSHPKNHVFLVDIFFQLQKLLPESILVLAGGGELLPKIKEKVNALRLQNKVFFMGVQNDVYRLYPCFDAFVFPSLYEGFGNALLEAQACGIQSFTSAGVVPQTVHVTPLLHYIPLDKTPREWAERILAQRGVPKQDTRTLIAASGYDIEANAEWLTNYYLKRIEES